MKLSARFVKAFTRIELLVVLVVVAALTMLLLPNLRRGKQQIVAASCLNNLRQLGVAMNLYFHDNKDKLPYAAIQLLAPTLTETREMTWDSLLNRYIGGRLTEAQLWNAAERLKVDAALPVLKCPSDPCPRPVIVPPPLPVYKRSYSMPAYMKTGGDPADRAPVVAWPPSSASQHGVGLDLNPLSRFWNKADRTTGAGSIANPRPSHQLAVKTGMILEPAGTILLTERFHVNNLMGFAERAAIKTADNHIGLGAGPVSAPPFNYPPASAIHGGSFYYLMVDGHVEFLPPAKTTTNLALQRGMWSIKAGD